MRATHLQTRSGYDRDSGRGAHLSAARDAPGRPGGSRTGRGPGISVEFEPGAGAASEARAALAALDGRVDSGALDDIRLLVSELVTNSVRHSGAAGARVALDVESRGDTVRVEVSDGGRGFEPRARSKAHDDVGGWGLHLVESIATRWGVQTGRRTRVWFEIDS